MDVEQIKDKNGTVLYYDDFIKYKDRVYLIKEIKVDGVLAMLCSRHDRYNYIIPVDDLAIKFELL